MSRSPEYATAQQRRRPSAETQQSPSKSRQQQTPAPAAGSGSSSGWFRIPAPLARLFNRFPLLTYPPNELPTRSPRTRDLPTLYVFISDQDALKGLPSFNPSCLKWQTFLRLAGVEFRTVPSNNHASPTGALPFLIPPTPPPGGGGGGPSDSKSPPQQTPAVVPSSKLEQWALSHGSGAAKLPDDSAPSSSSMKLEAYEALLDHRIRAAWLYALYLSPANSALLSHLYVAPTSASQVVRATIRHQLRRAAESEIVKVSGGSSLSVNPAAVYDGAREAFGALAAVLGEDPWFFGSSGPGLFDATVFSYTHLILDEGLAWENRKLVEIVEGFPSLVRHRDRILQRCWPSLSSA
ncbi:hypothetical protein SLS62_003295 [Diatrype stigma]|uniref:Mitochondrial outer membrane protein n=1 Tax=Diatrype stigma TaxID=117547 RepID=A0AAN9UWS6_9PEZI